MKTNTIRLLLMALLMFVAEALHADNNPLCFTARNGSVVVNFTIANVTPSTIQYSTNLTSWNTCSEYTSVTINADESVYFRAATDKTSSTAVAFGDYYSSSSSNFSFTSSDGGTVEGSGNIMSLYGPSCPNIQLPSYAFAYMFSGCTLLTSAPKLPATSLADYCYSNMFQGCTALTSAPALPATSLATCCYSYMFQGCTALTSAPVLPATTLHNNCYYCMFYRCTALTSAPALPATSLATSCYSNMFYGCTALTYAPALPATSLATSCYSNMFDGCTALTSAPALPATSLATSCYSNMFCGCTALTSIPDLPATALPDNCYYSMFYGCTSLKVNTAPPGKAWRLNASSMGSAPLTNMFYNTGGTMNGTPSTNTTYYLYLTAKDSICHDTICFGEPYNNYGFDISSTDIVMGNNTFTLTKSGVNYKDPDTVITLHLNVPATHHDIPKTMCMGDVYQFAGQTLTVSGDYTDIGVSLYGCADTTVLHLTVVDAYETDKHIVINEGESYSCGSNDYTEAGDYTVTLSSVDGCDSIVNLHISVLGNTLSVGNTTTSDISILTQDNRIIIHGAEGDTVMLYDAVGRLITTISNATEPAIITVPAAGVYILKTDNGHISRVVVR